MPLPEENVWNYPRPPRLEPVSDTLRVIFAGVEIARTARGFRVLETSHPPTFYIPPSDVLEGALLPAPGGSICEWKGAARYWTAVAGGRSADRAAWSYAAPTVGFAAIRDHVAFYPGAMDLCSVGGEVVTVQPGDFYGGWITANLRGPFKGAPGTTGW